MSWAAVPELLGQADYLLHLLSTWAQRLLGSMCAILCAKYDQLISWFMVITGCDMVQHDVAGAIWAMRDWCTQQVLSDVPVHVHDEGSTYLQ